MKRRILLFLMAFIGLFALVLAGCTQEPPKNSNGTTNPPLTVKSNILIAYFSHSGNTENIAEIIAEQTGGDLLVLTPAQAFPSDYHTLLGIAQDELSENARPALSSECSVDMDEYDIVFIGFPLWHAREPMLINTFLESYDFKGKQMIPFSTSGSSSALSAYSAIQTRCPNAEFLAGKNLISWELSDAETIISTWLDGLDIGDDLIMNRLYITVNRTTLTATLVDNSSTQALKELLSEKDLTIEMSDYGNFEKVGSLGVSLPRNDEQITTTAGDLILYQGNSFVIYYDTNSWNFTRLGKIEYITQTQLMDLLGECSVMITLSLSE